MVMEVRNLQEDMAVTGKRLGLVTHEPKADGCHLGVPESLCFGRAQST